VDPNATGWRTSARDGRARGGGVDGNGSPPARRQAARHHGCAGRSGPGRGGTHAGALDGVRARRRCVRPASRSSRSTAGSKGRGLGESAGRPLLLVSDEVRAQAARGGESAARAGDDARRGRRRDWGTSAGSSIRCASSHRTSRTRPRARRPRGGGRSGPAPRCRRVEARDRSRPRDGDGHREAGEHARALVSSLGALSGRVPGRSSCRAPPDDRASHAHPGRGRRRGACRVTTAIPSSPDSCSRARAPLRDAGGRHRPRVGAPRCARR